jgi:hypothetical protein
MNLQELLWKYADGECNADELKQVEKLLSENEGIAENLRQIISIHTSLKVIKPEKPSLQFTQNVMDMLPDIYPSEFNESLVGAFWKKFGFSVFLTLVVSIFLSQKVATDGQSIKMIDFGIYTEKFSQFITSMPPSYTLYFLMLLATAGLLAGFDLILKRVTIAHQLRGRA